MGRQTVDSTSTETSSHLGDPRRVDWAASDGAKGRGDVGSQLWVLGDYCSMEQEALVLTYTSGI